MNDPTAFLQETRWSPYVVGVALGVLSWLTFLFSNKALGVSTAFARTGGMIEKALRGSEVEQREYYRKYEPKIDWGWMLVAGMLAGAFISSASSGDFRVEWIPSLWESRFGSSHLLRIMAALAGGALMGIGARWAGGCTSGHALSGSMQLAASGWLAALCFFVGGIAAAFMIFGPAVQ
jgi:hypothetical protein